MIPAWALKVASTILTMAGALGFSTYVLGHVKPPVAPLHPRLVEEVAVETVPAPASATEPDAPTPAPVVIVKVVKIQVPNPAQAAPQGTVSLSGWLNQTNVPQATTTYAS